MYSVHKIMHGNKVHFKKQDKLMDFGVNSAKSSLDGVSDSMLQFICNYNMLSFATVSENIHSGLKWLLFCFFQ